MDYTGDGQIVHLFNPSGVIERVRVPTFGGDVLHVVRDYDSDTGRLRAERVEITSVAQEAGWSFDAPAKKVAKKATKKK